MRPLNCSVISGSDNQNINGSKIDTSQLSAASFQAYFGDTQAAGTLQLQGSNDPCAFGNLAVNFTPTNWTNIPTSGIQIGSATVTSGASVLCLLPVICYRWLRATWTTTGTGTQTIVPRADVSGNLNNTYFLLQDAASAHLYYVWFNINSAGVDPLIAGRTGVPITGATNVSAATLGTSIASAIAALNGTNSFTATGTTTVTVTNKVAGPFVPMTDGAVPTGFTFATTAGGNSTINVNLNAAGSSR